MAESKSGNRILLVEDEALVAMVTADTLADLGFEVVEAATAAAALDHAKQDIKSFMAAVIDIGLPDRRGDEVALELLKLRGDFPIVIATGHGANTLPDSLKGALHIKVLGKPYDSHSLREALVSVGVAISTEA